MFFRGDLIAASQQVKALSFDSVLVLTEGSAGALVNLEASSWLRNLGLRPKIHVGSVNFRIARDPGSIPKNFAC
jgi:hypothetical protein